MLPALRGASPRHFGAPLSLPPLVIGERERGGDPLSPRHCIRQRLCLDHAVMKMSETVFVPGAQAGWPRGGNSGTTAGVVVLSSPQIWPSFPRVL